MLKKLPKERISLKEIDKELGLKIEWKDDNEFRSKLPW